MKDVKNSEFIKLNKKKIIKIVFMMLYKMNLLIILIVQNYKIFHFFKEKQKLEKMKMMQMNHVFNKRVYMKW